MTNVMLVEDEDDAREILATALEDAGYQILRANNGAVALTLLQSNENRCDIIVLDLMMPIMSGWDFRRKQREDRRFSHIPVLLMSAGAHIDTVAGELGAAGFVSKPVEIPDLLKSIRKYTT
jgi:CheY-like chemotaxis protein